MRNRLYIERWVIAVLLLLLLAVAPAMAQNVVYQGQTTTLTVEQMGGDTYVWELYNDSTVNFATRTGTAVADGDAEFVGTNTGISVDVIWNKPGTYFCKVTALDASGCTMNLKVGILKVIEAMPMAEIKPDLKAVCAGEEVSLEVTFTGTAPWSFTYSATDSIGTIYKIVTGVMTSPYLLIPDPKPLLTTEYRITSITDQHGTNTEGSDSVIQTINPMPETSLIYLVNGLLNTGEVPICPDESVAYGVIDTPSSSYSWKINNDTISNDWTITATGHNTISVLWKKAGTYILTVQETTDAGCPGPIQSMNVIVNPPVISLAGIVQPTDCGNEGQIVLSFTGVPDDTYTIFHRNGSFANVVVTDNNATIYAPAGMYYDLQITVNGCTSVNGVNAVITDFSAPQTPLVKILSSPTCTEAIGSVELSGLPEGDWTINPGNIKGNASTYTITDLAANTNYSFTVTNAGGCISGGAEVIFPLSAPEPPTVRVTVQPGCNIPTGTIQVTAPLPVEGIVYVLTGISPVTDPVTNTTGLFEGLLPNARYGVKVMDVKSGCYSTEVVSQINALPANQAAPDLTVSKVPFCSNPEGTIMVNRPRGTDYQYSLDGGPYQGSAIFAGLMWGDHTVRVRNIKTGCVSSESKITVPAIPPPPVLTALAEPSICPDGTGIIHFTVTNIPAGNYTIKHSDGEFTVWISSKGIGKVSVPTGSYNNLVIGADSCSSYRPDQPVNVVVDHPAPIVINHSITPINLLTGTKGAISVDAAGGNGDFTYLWDTGSTTSKISNLDEGSYVVTVSDKNGCSKSDTIKIPAPLSLPKAVDDLYVLQCNIISGNVILNDSIDKENIFRVDIKPVQRPLHGTVQLSSDGAFEYRADPMFMGVDSFSYALFDKYEYPGVNATVVLQVIPDTDHDGVDDPPLADLSKGDKDADGDGLLNALDGYADADGDGLPNYLDIDSDGDGILDHYEIQPMDNYTKPAFLDVNNNGVDDAYDNYQMTSELEAVDSDKDNIPDYLDLDSENDLVPDFIEGHDENGDGKPDHTAIGKDTDHDGLDDGYDTYTLECDPMDNILRSHASMQDFEGDGIPDWRDENDDDDEFPTRFEDMDGNNDLSNDDFDYDGTPEYLDYGRDCDLFIPDAFSPNGDGVHDFYQVYCINHFPNAKIHIFDQLGNKLFEKSNYGNLEVWGHNEAAWWDGRPDRGRGRNELVPPGTYYYVLDLGNGEVKKSFVFVSY